MTFGSPTGGSEVSQDEQLATRLPNGKEANFFNVEAKILQERLQIAEKAKRRCTPDIETPFQSEIPPMQAKQQCTGLWSSLPDKETLDEARERIPSAWYQVYLALAMIQLLVSMAEEKGTWSSSPVLFEDGSNSHEEDELSYSYWRDVSVSACRILREKMGATKTDIRAHLQQKIGLNAFWELERDFLRPIAAVEEDKYRDAMTKKWQQPRSEQPSPARATTRRATPRQTTPQALKAQRPGKVDKITARQGKKTGLGTRGNRALLSATTTRRNAAPGTARGVPGNSTNSGSVGGDSFASTGATGKSSRIAYDLSSKNIITIGNDDKDNDKRILRRRANPPRQTSR